MATYDWIFDGLGLRAWCDGGAVAKTMSMAELLTKSGVKGDTSWWRLPFPSLDELNSACGAVARTRDMTSGVANAFLAAKNSMKMVLDPLTQPLSWMLDASLQFFPGIPWFILIPALVLLAHIIGRSRMVTLLVALTLVFLAAIDHFSYAVQTLSIIFVCTTICLLLGIPIGIVMSRSDRLRQMFIPVLDMLQTLPTFVYLIPLIFLFSVTESKLYGIAIILYAIVPVIRLTDLGIRLVDKDVSEAADAFGMTRWQKLLQVEIPLALPNIMAGVNQTIMMALAMVVIASLVSAPGLGVLVLRGINNLELGVGLVAGLGIVLLAILLDRVSKAALARTQRTHST